MFRSLLVPLDGSVLGEHALPPAISLARRMGAALHLVHVHVPFFGEAELFDNTLDLKAREAEQAYVDAVTSRVKTAAPAAVSCSVLDGPTATALQEYASNVKADLTVITTHGRGALARFWLGSVADRLIRSLTTPILLVRPKEGAPDLAQDQTFQHILVPLDGSELAEQVLEPAVALGAAMQAEYLLVRVVDPLQTAGHDPAGFPISGLVAAGRQRLQEQATAYLDRVAERLRAQSLRVSTRVLVNTQAVGAILELAGTAPIDLIALATHGRGGLTRLLLGSVADKVLRGATTPMLVYRPVGE